MTAQQVSRYIELVNRRTQILKNHISEIKKYIEDTHLTE